MISQYQNFMPVFQPIFSVEDCDVVGFESLGRLRLPDGNLVPVAEFVDPRTTVERLTELDRILLGLAFGNLVNSHDLLFINMSPDQVILEFEESKSGQLPIGNMVRSFGIPPSQIVVEITEKLSSYSIEVLSAGVELLREEGFKIALDDVGTESSNLERLGAIKPDIIKVDLNLLKNAIEKREFQSILEYLKQIALGIGSELLFEGIETEIELYRAIESGASLLQGYFLGRPSDFNISKQGIKDKMIPYLEQYHHSKRIEVSKEIEFEKTIQNKLDESDLKTVSIGNRIVIDPNIFFKLHPAIQRVYITDSVGTQVSSYYQRIGKFDFIENILMVQKNWSYMPFFYKHVKQVFRDPGRWQVSDPYWDKDLKKNVIVFSKVNDMGFSFFIDVLIGVE
ncbi:EAL domain-containing protein [Leptospira sp. 96542]|nr:EAL domain-containing protein [Leptospira sp. 96542]